MTELPCRNKAARVKRRPSPPPRLPERRSETAPFPHRSNQSSRSSYHAFEIIDSKADSSSSRWTSYGVQTLLFQRCTSRPSAPINAVRRLCEIKPLSGSCTKPNIEATVLICSSLPVAKLQHFSLA